jgi:glycosyltransferase involved in cell wall biosynthesis
VTFEVRHRYPNVLVVTNLWPHADDPAYGIFVKRQVDSLHDVGVRADVLFIRGYLSPAAYTRAAVVLAKLSRSAHPPYDLVHAHGGEAVLSAAAYRRAPVLASYLGDDLLGTRNGDGTFPLPKRARRAILRRSAWFIGHTITKSREMELALPRTCRGRNDVVPNGVDDSVFVPMSRERAREALGWAADAKIVLFGGNPRFAGKRFWLAKAACEEAAAEIGHVQLETLSGIEPDDVPVVMNAADCLLLTSITEGSPNAVKEALMCNLPVVSTRVGDVVDLLRDVRPSWLCDPSPGAIAEALVSCLSTPCRSDGRRHSMHLTTAAIAKRVVAVYETILSPGSFGASDVADDVLPAASAL